MENLNSQNSEVIGYKCKLFHKSYITNISLFAIMSGVFISFLIVLLVYGSEYYYFLITAALICIWTGYLTLELNKLRTYNKLPENCILRNDTTLTFFADNNWHSVDTREIVYTEVKPTKWHGLVYRDLKLSGSLIIRYSNGSTFEVKQLDNVAEVGKKLANRSQSFSQSYIR